MWTRPQEELTEILEGLCGCGYGSYVELSSLPFDDLSRLMIIRKNRQDLEAMQKATK